MLETSKDVLYIVLAFSIGLISFFIAWGLYYIVMILREGKKFVTEIRKKIELVEKVLIAFKERLENTSSHMKLLVETALNVANFIKDRKKEKKTAGKSRSKKK